jgi:hypothetical protein
MDITKLNRKYYLHRKLRNQNIRYNSNLKTIYLVPDYDLFVLPAIFDLKNNFNYQIQYIIE